MVPSDPRTYGFPLGPARRSSYGWAVRRVPHAWSRAAGGRRLEWGETSGEAGGGEPLTAEIYLDFNVVGSMEVLTPAVLLALPGMVIAASLVAQLAGGIPWIPLTRRFIGGPQAPASGRAGRTRG